MLSEHDKEYLKEFPDRDKFVNYLTGQLLTDLGQGVRIRNIVSQIVLQTQRWTGLYRQAQAERFNPQTGEQLTPSQIKAGL